MIQAMLDDDPFLTEKGLLTLFHGKSPEECQQSILDSKEQMLQARTILEGMK